jgi:hypothetical protein
MALERHSVDVDGVRLEPDGRGVVGGTRTVGPTFPLVCKPAA